MQYNFPMKAFKKYLMISYRGYFGSKLSVIRWHPINLNCFFFWSSIMGRHWKILWELGRESKHVGSSSTIPTTVNIILCIHLFIGWVKFVAIFLLFYIFKWHWQQFGINTDKYNNSFATNDNLSSITASSEYEVYGQNCSTYNQERLLSHTYQLSCCVVLGKLKTETICTKDTNIPYFWLFIAFNVNEEGVGFLFLKQTFEY